MGKPATVQAFKSKNKLAKLNVLNWQLATFVLINTRIYNSMSETDWQQIYKALKTLLLIKQKNKTKTFVLLIVEIYYF